MINMFNGPKGEKPLIICPMYTFLDTTQPFLLVKSNRSCYTMIEFVRLKIQCLKESSRYQSALFSQQCHVAGNLVRLKGKWEADHHLYMWPFE